MRRIELEICVETIEGLAAARAGGADRVELCAALRVGGLLPARSVVAASVDSGFPVHVLVRLEDGGFAVDRPTVERVADEIRAMRELGAAGVVVGALTADGRLDVSALERWREAAGGMTMTLHRAIDLCADPIEGVDVAESIGIDRILTSGRQRCAIDGVSTIAAMAARAAGRIGIMAGAGVRPEQVEALLDAGANAIHASAGSDVAFEDPRIESFGFGGASRRTTSQSKVGAIRSAIDRWAADGRERADQRR